MDRAVANEEAIAGRESEIRSCIFAEAPKLSREAHLVCQLKHNVGSNPSRLPKHFSYEQRKKIQHTKKILA